MHRFFLILLAILLAAPELRAGCNMPVAVADTADNYGGTVVVDVLANDSDADGDALAVDITGDTCTDATISVSGSLLRVEPFEHRPVTCSIGYRVTDATGRTSTAQVQLVAATLGPLFADGFEPGSTAAWSLTCTTACSPEPES